MLERPPVLNPTAASAVPVAAAPAAADLRDRQIWLLLSDKLGDNAQVNTLAAALGLACTPKQLRFKPRFGQMRPVFKPSLQHLDAARSDALTAPWPDLVIVSGRRPGADPGGLRQLWRCRRLVHVGVVRPGCDVRDDPGQCP